VTKKEKAAAYSRAWRAANRAKIVAYRVAYRALNPKKFAAYEVARRAADPEKEAERQVTYRAANRAAIAAQSAAYRNTPEGWAKGALCAAKNRAKKRGVPCTITVELLLRLRALSTYCPALKLELKYGNGKRASNSATLDCIDPALGYIPGNVVIMSFRANVIKQDASAAELRQVADFVAAIAPHSRAKIAANSVSSKETT
jgi:hypothetical protein